MPTAAGFEKRLSRTKGHEQKKTIEYVKNSGAIEASNKEMLSLWRKKVPHRVLNPSEAVTA